MKIELTKEVAEAILRAQGDLEQFAGQAQRSNVKWTQLWVLAERIAGRTIDSSPVDDGVNWRLRLGLEPLWTVVDKPEGNLPEEFLEIWADVTTSPEVMGPWLDPTLGKAYDVPDRESKPIGPDTTPEEMQRRMLRRPNVPDREEMHRILKRRSIELQSHKPVPVTITVRDLMTHIWVSTGFDRLHVDRLNEIVKRFKCEGFEIDTNPDPQYISGHIEWSDLVNREMILIHPTSSKLPRPAKEALENVLFDMMFGVPE
ncbi:MAG: hypothetical protein ACYS7Y_04460 [Planctomycetota bacterium]|jgi:hypothetical protein